MTGRLWGCKKFRRLAGEQADRELTPRQAAFLEKHRTVCSECCEAEEQSSMALNMLRMATLDPCPPPAFEERVLRRYRVGAVRESLSYWSPAFVGASIACIAIFAALALIGRPSQVSRTTGSADQVKRVVDPSNRFPNLDLKDYVRYVQ